MKDLNMKQKVTLQSPKSCSSIFLSDRKERWQPHHRRNCRHNGGAGEKTNMEETLTNSKDNLGSDLHHKHRSEGTGKKTNMKHNRWRKSKRPMVYRELKTGNPCGAYW